MPTLLFDLLNQCILVFDVFIESSILYENSRKSISLQALKDILGYFGFFDLLEPYFFQPSSAVL